MKNQKTPKTGPAGTTNQMPRWEGPEESRPSGYLPAKDVPEKDSDADSESIRNSKRSNPRDAG